MSNTGHVDLHDTTLFNPSPIPGAMHNHLSVEERENGFERPPPKGPAELFNPKSTRRPGGNVKAISPPDRSGEKEKERPPPESLAGQLVLDKLRSLTIGFHDPSGIDMQPPSTQEGATVAFPT